MASVRPPISLSSVALLMLVVVIEPLPAGQFEACSEGLVDVGLGPSEAGGTLALSVT